MSVKESGVEIVGADANNLKNVDVTLPRRGVSMIVGVSGSGKSSLLSATLAAEGEKRLGTFLGVPAMADHRNDVAAFIGPLSPTVHVGQRTFRASVRTTVGTSTGLLALLRRLFLACSKPWSDEEKEAVPPPSVETYAAWIAKHHEGKITIWAVPARLEQTDGTREVARLAKAGVKQVVIWGPRRGQRDSKGRQVEVSAFRPLSMNEPHTIEAEIASLSVGDKTASSKIQDALERAFAAGQGKVVVELHGNAHPDVQSEFGPRLDSTTAWVLPGDPRVYAVASRPLLSFNAPGQPQSGACKQCHGTGRATTVREDLLVTQPRRSMHGGAFAIWTAKNYKHLNIQHETIEGLRGMAGFDPDVPWVKLPRAARELVLGGTSQLVVDLEPRTRRKMSAPRRYFGFRQAIAERVAKPGRTGAVLKEFVDEGPCPECHGSRWSHQARALRVAGEGIDSLLARTFDQLVDVTDAKAPLLKAAGASEAGIVRALHQHAGAFVSVGLAHLSGDRGMLDISEGESRRTRLAGVLNAREEGLLLLLDEPARGLHDIDLAAMSDVLRGLGDHHTVVLNEHRKGLAGAADYLVEMGPGAGAAGGTVVFSGPMKQSKWRSSEALTRKALIVERKGPHLSITGATLHNLQSVDVMIPLGRLTCLTGVSGSGKSNFARGVLVPAVARSLGLAVAREDFDVRPGQWAGLSGEKVIKGLVALDHKPPPPNRRSTVATFLDVAEPLRKAFAATAAAHAAGLTVGDFGLNSGGGRCSTCLGIGETEEEGGWATCAACAGGGYSQAALTPTVDGLTIRDTLALPVSDVLERSSWIGDRRSLLEAMRDLGVGHIALGRRLDTMSGGEVQRLRIAQRLAEHTKGGLLFVLDEPAAGLHQEDARRLLGALDRILDGGRNTIVLVEHNIPIIHAADWVIEFGPGTGAAGGQVVASGTPAQIARTKCATGRVLAAGDGGLGQKRSAPRSERKDRRGSTADLIGMAERVVASVRRLRGDDVAAAVDSGEEGAPDRPLVVLSPKSVAGRRVHEVADLDIELAHVLLDARAQRDDEAADLAKAWRRTGGWLAIQPFMGELQIWGDMLPRSVMKAVTARLRTSELKLVDLRGRPSKETAPDWRELRASGERFASPPDDEKIAVQRVTEAAALGGAYLELRSSAGALVQSMSRRLFDPETGAVGPFAPSTEHFSRHHSRGRCPACLGPGVVHTVPEELVIASATADPADERFLTPEASKILKGVFHAELRPLVKHMVVEGLWKAGASYRSLGERERTILLYGCWARPGHGTFVRGTKADPTEVGSWIRWDGLFRHLFQELHRSGDEAWRSRVEASRTGTSCPVCDGTGYQRCAGLLLLGEESLASFVGKRTVADLDHALSKVRVGAPRQKLRIARVRRCIEPAVRAAPRQLLRKSPDLGTAMNVAKRCVETFTDMESVLP